MKGAWATHTVVIDRRRAAEMQMIRRLSIRSESTRGTSLARAQRVSAELSLPVPIAVVLTSFEPGGTERQMTELIRRLDPQRFRVHVACFRKTGAWLERVETAAVEIQPFTLRSFKSPASLSTLRDFAKWLRLRDIALVQACDLYANVFALPGAALAGVPVRIGARRELAPPEPIACSIAVTISSASLFRP